MTIRILRIPQLGEGLQEVTIIRLLKQPGDHIERDEPLYQVETDKALVDIEASCSGVLDQWYCEEGSTAAIDAPVVGVRIVEAQDVSHPVSGSAETQDVYTLKTSPSFRGEVVQQTQLSRDTRVLSFEQKPPSVREHAIPHVEGAQTHTLSPGQQALVRRMSRQTEAIPATIHGRIDWNAFRMTLADVEAKNVIHGITDFEYFAYGVSRSVRKHAAFRSRIVGYDVTVYPHLNLGIAVSKRNGEMAIAVVNDADTLDVVEFLAALREAVKSARRGVEQVGAVMQLQLTHLGTLGVVSATPVLVPPAMGTLFLGAPIPSGDGEAATLSLIFDHRLVNGVGAAMYLRDLTKFLCGTSRNIE